MIIPNYHIDKEGNLVFEITHISESKIEQKKLWFDRKTYKNYVIIDPVTNKIIKCTCECPDFQFRRNRYTACKHLNKSIGLFKDLGVRTLWATENENEMYDLEQGLWLSKTNIPMERGETERVQRQE